MTGQAEFNEVYITEARIPDDTASVPSGTAGGWR